MQHVVTRVGSSSTISLYNNSINSVTQKSRLGPRVAYGEYVTYSPQAWTSTYSV